MTLSSLADLPNYVREYLGFFQGCRKLGFGADDILFVVGGHPFYEFKHLVQGWLRAQGKQFVFDCGGTDDDPEVITDAYDALVRLLPTTSDEELAAACNATFVMRRKAEFVLALSNKGFYIPVGVN